MFLRGGAEWVLFIHLHFLGVELPDLVVIRGMSGLAAARRMNCCIIVKRQVHSSVERR
ncbi:hypothetical protein EMIT0P201_50062 [Pseudomonas chlororaphis]